MSVVVVRVRFSVNKASTMFCSHLGSGMNIKVTNSRNCIVVYIVIKQIEKKSYLNDFFTTMQRMHKYKLQKS